MVHHFSAEAKGPRGATELRAFPDQIADLFLFVADDFADRRRVLKSRGRLTPEPSAITIKLNPDGTDYEVLDSVTLSGTPAPQRNVTYKSNAEKQAAYRLRKKQQEAFPFIKDHDQPYDPEISSSLSGG